MFGGVSERGQRKVSEAGSEVSQHIFEEGFPRAFQREVQKRFLTVPLGFEGFGTGCREVGVVK